MTHFDHRNTNKAI